MFSNPIFINKNKKKLKSIAYYCMNSINFLQKLHLNFNNLKYNNSFITLMSTCLFFLNYYSRLDLI